jgi:3',5'-cyclic AMP phosphodiesterase CpdA
MNIIQISDFHVDESPSAISHGENARRNLCRMLEHVAAFVGDVDLVVSTGDLSKALLSVCEFRLWRAVPVCRGRCQYHQGDSVFRGAFPSGAAARLLLDRLATTMYSK